MDDLLHSKSNMSSLTTVSSTGRKSEAQSECSTSSIDSCLEDEKPVHSKLIITLCIVHSNSMFSKIYSFGLRIDTYYN